MNDPHNDGYLDDLARRGVARTKRTTGNGAALFALVFIACVVYEMVSLVIHSL
jgi:hypothetical protein